MENMIPKFVLTKLAGGNPGAITFLLDIVKILNKDDACMVYDKIIQSESLRGTNIYILWNDLAERDMKKVVKLCKNCPSGILEDACSRQDRSGIPLIQEYL